MYKNIMKQTNLKLKDLVDYQEGQVVSKTLVQNDQMSMTIFSFDEGGRNLYPCFRRRRYGHCAGRHRTVYRGRRGVHSARGGDSDHAKRYPACGIWRREV